MSLCRLLGNSTSGLCALAFLLMSGAGVASADRVVNANVPVVISDDITNQVTEVISAGSGGEEEEGGGQCTICHRPPGNSSNESTLTVGCPAVPAHLAHGDSEGGCS